MIAWKGHEPWVKSQLCHTRTLFFLEMYHPVCALVFMITLFESVILKINAGVCKNPAHGHVLRPA